jgi:hypothetical protein
MGIDTEDPDEPGPPPRGRVLDNVIPVAKVVGNMAWEGTKLGVGAALAVGGFVVESSSKTQHGRRP